MTANGTSSPDEPRDEIPTSMLHLLHSMLANKERTANFAEAVTSTSKAIARVLLSAGLVLLAIVGLALVIVNITGFGPIGGAIAVGGTGAVWGAYLLRKRHVNKRGRSRRR